MEASPIPKVHLIRTTDFDKKDYDNLFLFLENICIKERGKIKGKDLFIKYDTYVTIPKDEVKEKKLNLKHLTQGVYALNFNGLGNSQSLFFVIIH